MPKFIDLTGLRFDRWLVLKACREDNNFIGWLCRCECGITKIVAAATLRNKSSRSCGCLKKELTRKRIKHGQRINQSTTPEYSTWLRILSRCHNPKDGSYLHYGGRGICVCEKWKNDFFAFLNDMGKHPGKGYSIDRIDNHGPYSPENCRWATYQQQARNRRNNRRLTLNDTTKLICEWAEQYHLNIDTILDRLRWGWSPEKTLTTPVRKHRKYKKRKIN